jgi:hypothetical protein
VWEPVVDLALLPLRKVAEAAGSRLVEIGSPQGALSIAFPTSAFPTSSNDPFIGVWNVGTWDFPDAAPVWRVTGRVFIFQKERDAERKKGLLYTGAMKLAYASLEAEKLSPLRRVAWSFRQAWSEPRRLPFNAIYGLNFSKEEDGIFRGRTWTVDRRPRGGPTKSGSFELSRVGKVIAGHFKNTDPPVVGDNGRPGVADFELTNRIHWRDYAKSVPLPEL